MGKPKVSVVCLMTLICGMSLECDGWTFGFPINIINLKHTKISLALQNYERAKNCFLQ